MNETEWLTGQDPEPLLWFLNERASDRKVRLICCAIVRHAPFAGNGRTAWDLLPEAWWFGTPTLNCHTVVESAERYADGHETPHSWHLAREFASDLDYFAEVDTFGEDDDSSEDDGSPYGDAALFLAMAQAVQHT